MSRVVVTWTADEWRSHATAKGGDLHALVADGRDYIVTVEKGDICHCKLDGPQAGSLTVRGDGDGFAWRDGDGDGFAYRDGDGDGSAYRDGRGDGAAIRDGSGDGSAYRVGWGDGVESDARGRRLWVPHVGIPYSVCAGYGHLRVGCETHTFDEWIRDADAIDARHRVGIAGLTRALAQQLSAGGGAK